MEPNKELHTTRVADAPTVYTAEDPSPISPPSVSTAEAGLAVVTREPEDDPTVSEQVLGIQFKLEPDRVVRPRVPTDRGLHYQLELRRNNLRVPINKWRHRADDINDLLVNCDDIGTLSKQRKVLLTLSEDAERSAEILSQVFAVEEPIGNILEETRQLRKDLNSKIRELKEEIRSTSSRKSSVSSKASATLSPSARIMKLEAAAKAAEVEIQLKYHRAEQELIKQEQ